MASHEIPDIANPAIDQPMLPGFERIERYAGAPIIDPVLLAVSIREAFKRGLDQATQPQQPQTEDLFAETRAEAKMNGSGMSSFVACAIASNAIPEQQDRAVRTRRADMVRAAAARPARSRKPRGRSYPEDESRADYGFNPNPTAAERAQLEKPEEGATYTGSGREEMLRNRPSLLHGAAMHDLGGLPPRNQVAAEIARLERDSHGQAS